VAATFLKNVPRGTKWGSLDKTEGKKNRKITTAYIFSDGRLIDATTLKRAEAPLSRKSFESEEIKSGKESVKDSNFVTPPYDLGNLASLYRRSTTHFRAVRAKAQDSVGRGWTIVSESGKAPEARRKAVQDALKAAGGREGFTEVLKKAVIDFESIGNGYIEIVRDEKGMLKQLNHIPGMTVRVSKDERAYLHQRGNKKVYFKPFGIEEGDMDKATGEYKALVLPADRANELVDLTKYDPNSDYYGIPDVIPALGAILGDLSARDYNLDFFENGAVPAYAITIEGADVSEEVKEAIEDFFRFDLKGQGNQHRTVVIPIPAELGANVKVVFHPLNVEVKDGHFRIFRQENRSEVLSAHGVPPGRAMIFQTGALNGDFSKEADAIYQDATIKPLQEFVATKINAVIAETLKAPDLRIKFNDSKIHDYATLGSFTTAVSGAKVLTPNEQRELLSPLFEGGLDAIEGGDDIWLDVGGIPTPIQEALSEASRVPQNPPDPNTPPPIPPAVDPIGQKRAHHHDIDYEDVDIENLQVMQREYEGVKDARSVARIKDRAPLVDEMTADLVKVFDKMLTAAYDALESSGKKFWRVWQSKAAPIRTGKILGAVEAFEDDIQHILLDQYSKAMKQGAVFAGKVLGSTVKIDNKAIYTLPDVGYEVSFRLTDPSVQRFLQTESTKMSRHITKTMSNRIRLQIEKGLYLGEGVDQIKERLQKTVGVPDLRDSAGRLITGEVRAAMIARTEVGKAYNVGEVRGYGSTGVVDDVTVVDGDDFDEPCKKANGQTWSFNRAEDEPLEHPNCTRGFIPNVKKNPF
jgi:PBSX family phage portal protein